jgi:hypothetical protein
MPSKSITKCKSKFLIVCNARSGSTWLSTTLGSLPDVFTEYEFKWKPLNKIPVPLHYILNKPETQIAPILDSIDNHHPVVGSRLVLGPRYHSSEDFNSIKSCLSEDLKIIHIHRSYEEILFSWAGPEDRFIKTTGQSFKGKISEEILNDRTVNYKKRNIEQRIIDNLKLITLKSLAKDSDHFVELKKQKINYKKHLSNYENELADQALKKGKFFFPKGGSSIYLRELLANDIWIKELAKTNDYIRIDYTEIKERFFEICSFIGSKASSKICEDVLKKPVVSKVVNKKPKNHIFDYESFSVLCKSYSEIFHS